MQNQQRRDSTSYADNASKRLWDRFGEMFGARFYDQFGSEPSRSWIVAVDEVRADQIKAALSKIRNSGSQYPPSLPEFLALARSQRLQQPAEQSSNLVQFDHFECFGNIQFFKFLRLYDVKQEQLPELLSRKREIIDAARHDPEMQVGGDGKAQGSELHEILFTAWRKAIGSTALPHMHRDGFMRAGEFS